MATRTAFSDCLRWVASLRARRLSICGDECIWRDPAELRVKAMDRFLLRVRACRSLRELRQICSLVLRTHSVYRSTSGTGDRVA
jgi:hypothetical protein